ncbi:Chaperone required for the assembly of the F1-ATPase [Roseovarius nanhaiticus]|uniref:Chaperone required for the assembly of the F1-ATPase n=1 Tax=Roseovarius nanhaiticus TaxID=573024 RepID=A0A1N7F1K5_9RHOB|nr:ATP12 family protein [Roseovarius nanhaiticus]SEK63122.1 Chaperone required for the assembly of the F1-ATPase [Roseovarius nanhaiticus]SIR94263.1 Chaperone required for the assembly of the F1-ATPase [Roseovarius nanhaiticus]
MSEWAAKRFWTDARVTEEDAGYGVALDSRAVKTPAKAPLVVPTPALAAAIAAEWDAIEEKIDPRKMPMTRSANAAIDKVAHQHAEVADMIAAYGETDLLCYRATSPQELVLRQAEEWDPLLDWADSALNARLRIAEGIMPHVQDPDVVQRLRSAVRGQGVFQLTALHDLVSLSGSLIIGLAVQHGARPAAELWEISRLDEAWQAELWGADEEAEDAAAIKRSAFLHAQEFYCLASEK